MSQALAEKLPTMKVRPTDAPVSDSAKGSIRAGLIILVLFFGGLGGWAAVAPLNAAVVGEAVVKVEGNRKSVQHLDGGVVKELRVREGDTVATGDVLIVLDDTTARAELDVLLQQVVNLRATQARLLAERDGATEIAFPPELTEAAAAAAMDNQRREFSSRQAAIVGETGILNERRSQLSAQIIGNEAQAEALREQLVSVLEERKKLQHLYDQGLIEQPRLLQLDRTAKGLEGQIATVDATIASSRRAIEENAQQVLQLSRDRLAEVTQQLSEVQSKLLDLAPRQHAAATSLERLEVRSPYAGRVVDLAVFSVGGVIGRGERLLDIVPAAPPLVVEARIRVEDIADIAPGMRAEVHFTSYKQRITPLIHGAVADISADRLTDQRTQVPYYVAHISVDPGELAASPEIQLYPGMPATVMITTKERTALDYIVGPLFASLDHSFRER